MDRYATRRPAPGLRRAARPPMAGRLSRTKPDRTVMGRTVMDRTVPGRTVMGRTVMGRTLMDRISRCTSSDSRRNC
jgi:hypothetical protein